MNPKGRHLISAGVLFSALAFSGATFAQSSSTSTPNSSDRAASTQSTTPPPASNRDSSRPSASSNTATPSGSAMSDRAQPSARANDNARSNVSANAVTEAHAMRASKIIGANVENANGDNIGEIKDMMVDARNERVRYVVLSHGGVLGIGDKLFAYPMSMVETKGTDSDKLVMNVNKEKLDLVRASDLIGKNFDDTNGKDAGEIEDLVVNSNNGNIEYAIVDFDDSWAKKTDGKLVAIPLSNITVSGDKNDKLVIQTTADRIDMSHAFASNQWPDFSDPAWAQQRGSAAAQSQRSSSAAPTSQSSAGSPRS